MSPLAFVHCMLFAHVSGELRLVQQYVKQQMTAFDATVLILNGALAFGLNVVSFTANKKAGALSMTVAGSLSILPMTIYVILSRRSGRMQRTSNRCSRSCWR